ncbi:hypothetical protein NARC_10393 [Candidatus Nitrosocosmicus arcticus]|uniref:Uncharacterized protein n=1 Tax=Candidatus Nitrosocosmicus arcticus TaxID=2035267 RepID=A0A557SZF8_9ARCH|nr:hypothetical protein NARC_10393 [Candidatus Nitrosocosmicus arcticus]
MFVALVLLIEPLAKIIIQYIKNGKNWLELLIHDVKFLDSHIIWIHFTMVKSIILVIGVAMNIYWVKHSDLRIGKSWISISFLRFISSACASCFSTGPDYRICWQNKNF